MQLQTRISEKFIERFSIPSDILNLQPIQKEFVHKSNKEYVWITEIKPVPEEYIVPSLLDVQHSFYAYAIPKLDCNFCFDHELDHIPFMMVVEIFRQIGVGGTHAYHQIPLKGFKNTMDEMEFGSLKFVEFDMPMLITCEDKVLKQTNSIQKRKIYYKLYQNNDLCAYMSTNIIVMNENLYNRMRNKCRIDSIKSTNLQIEPVTNIQMLESQLIY
jgi:hypothetical protein